MTPLGWDVLHLLLSLVGALIIRAGALYWAGSGSGPERGWRR